MRYFIGFLLAIGLLILLIVMLFRGGGDKAKVPSTEKTLASYASTDAETSLTVDGPINAQSIHAQSRIRVGRDEVVFEQLKGYNGDVTDTHRYANTEESYRVFLLALTKVGFTKVNTDPALKDERGYCPTGNRYIMQLNDSGKDVIRSWATSCGNPKTYLGNVNLTLTLFRAQVPDYDQVSQTPAL